MGRVNSNSSDNFYWSIFSGTQDTERSLLGRNGAVFYRNVPEDEARTNGKLNSYYRERVNKNGKTVYEEVSEALSGYVVDLIYRDGKFGKQMIIVLEDNGERHSIQMNAFNESKNITPYASALCENLALIPFKDTLVCMTPYSREKDGWTNKGFYLSKDDENLGDFRNKFLCDTETFLSHVQQKPKGEDVTLADGSVSKDYKKKNDWLFSQWEAAMERMNQGEVRKESTEKEEATVDALPF